MYESDEVKVRADLSPYHTVDMRLRLMRSKPQCHTTVLKAALSPQMALVPSVLMTVNQCNSFIDS